MKIDSVRSTDGLRFEHLVMCMAAVCLVAVVNVLAFTSSTAIAIPGSDAWYFLDSFVRPAVEGNLRLADFFVQRGADDHAQPMQKAVLWLHLKLAHLDFRIEALVGVVAGILACAWLAWRMLRTNAGKDRTLSAAGACLIFVIGLSLNSTNIYIWSLVTLGWLLLLVCFLYWSTLARCRTTAQMVVLALCSTWLVSMLIDELIYPAFVAVVMATMVRDGVRRPKNTLALAISGGLGLLLGRALLQVLSPDHEAASDGGSSLQDLLAVISQPDAWKILVGPLSDSLIHRMNIEAIAPSLVNPISIALAIGLSLLHILFWWKVLLSKKRPSAEVLVIAVAMMLFFYAVVVGIVLSRVPIFGMDYLHQPRYVMMYQLNIIALVLAFFSPMQSDEGPEYSSSLRWKPLSTFVILVLIQIPLSKMAWDSAKYEKQYARNAELVLTELGKNPRLIPTEGCPPILTVCELGLPKRIELLKMLQKHRLSIYSEEDSAITSTATATTQNSGVSCAAEIVDWGPKRITPGVPFNQQNDGRSAFWVKLLPDASGFAVHLDGRRIPFDRSADTISFFAEDVIEESIPGTDKLEFQFVCGTSVVSSFAVELTKKP